VVTGPTLTMSEATRPQRVASTTAPEARYGMSLRLVGPANLAMIHARHEVPSPFVFAAHQEVNMGLIRVVVGHAEPLQTRAQIELHFINQFARVSLEVKLSTGLAHFKACSR